MSPQFRSQRMFALRCLGIIGLAVGGLASAAPAAAATDYEPEPMGLRDLIIRFEADTGALGRTYRIPTASADRERLRRYERQALDRLEALEFEALDRDAQVDFLLLKNEIDYRLRRLDREAERDEAIAALLPFREAIIELEAARRRVDPPEPRVAAGRIAGLADQVEGLIKRLEEGGELKAIDPADARRAADRVEELRRTLRSWFGFYNGYDPLLTWWVEAPYERADQALEAYASRVRRELGGVDESDEDAIVGQPIGREALRDELDHEMIPYEPRDLIAIADREFAWCDAEMLKAAEDLGYGGDVAAALEHVKQQFVEPGEQPALIQELAVEAVDFLEERDLVTIPALCKETWRMRMMSPRRQRVNPFFTGGEVISVSYPTDGMTHEEKLMSMRGNNRHFSKATVHHELIPGHHLQQFMNARYRTDRRAFRTPFWTEGWALYWEMRLWDLDFPETPEDRIGMLFWRMHRCARILLSLRYHLGEITPEEAIAFLVERVGFERANAEAEVRRWVRGGYSPLYQCAYMIGGLQFRALRGELVETGKMTEREYHDAVLRLGPIPVAMVRASLTEIELSPDGPPEWRFEGELQEAEELSNERPGEDQ